jgi:hypothetical protein
MNGMGSSCILFLRAQSFGFYILNYGGMAIYSLGFS